ncbi:bifunctional phosphopantothenoylcysteine decarboxylase/phosphopantothenate--cysteine ligase CoaBC [Microbacterium terricola]|uniref:bifunctional phosphopantothenoylcysteine decarboxylase/phosphopantothenate--cysteine ligase CoaBC n=1 Tax=Microbacterium terricola TaxID=344163 RepID=UPI0021E87CE1|nr:bifunctional phosphopantothenoylcysteine decarboxylase/phosphopantothenate--cysteine ligase CoaBC [Microbacterium terricola]UYK39078.1 bifunctional phosphopantothenoylcysteine decarboxylase/phosphopantothenate--cysteine ligase CoaBC [Microbacterium terricola]
MFVVVGVTGGIAAYKSVQLVRLLVRDGHEVHVVPTADALRFVGLPTWEAISRNPVTTTVHEDVARVRHVALGQAADLVIVAPATANSLAKMAAGLADDLLGTTLLATTAPVVVAPAMHTEMWRHPATQHNIATLKSRGVHVVGPDDGALTGDDSGLGRMTEPEAILAAALAVVEDDGAAEGDAADDDAARPVVRRHDLMGLSVVVSAGGTREPIDPVRFIGNRSSGKQGVALAVAAAERGADVILIAAHVDAEVLADALAHPAVRIERAGTTDDLADAVQTAAVSADVVVMAAAVADYRVAGISDRKITKDSAESTTRTLELVENVDILAALCRQRRPGQLIVGFAAETPAEGESLAERARRKVLRKDADLLAANEVGWTQGFEADENALVIVDRAGDVVAEPHGTKREVAEAVWDAVLSIHTP